MLLVFLFSSFIHAHIVVDMLCNRNCYCYFDRWKMFCAHFRQYKYTHNWCWASVHERIAFKRVEKREGEQGPERRMPKRINRLHYQINKYRWIWINHPKQVCVCEPFDEHESVPICCSHIRLMMITKFVYSFSLETFAVAAFEINRLF